jgi:hypothetical protein
MKIATTAAFIPGVSVHTIAAPLSDRVSLDPAEAEAKASGLALLLHDKDFRKSVLELAEDAFSTAFDTVGRPIQTGPLQDPLYAIATDAVDLATTVSVGDKFEIQLGSVTIVADIVQNLTQHVPGASILISFVKVSATGLVAWQRSKDDSAHQQIGNPLQEALIRSYTARYVAPKKSADDLAFLTLQLPEVKFANGYVAEQLERLKKMT